MLIYSSSNFLDHKYNPLGRIGQGQSPRSVLQTDIQISFLSPEFIMETKN